MVFGRKGSKDDVKDDDDLETTPSIRVKINVNALCSVNGFICVGSSKLHIFDKSTHEFLAEAKAGHDITSLCAADDNLLYAGLESGGVKSLDMGQNDGGKPKFASSFSKDKLMTKGTAHHAAINSLEIRGKDIFSGSVEGSAAVWNLDTAQLVHSLPAPKKGGKAHVVRHVPAIKVCLVAVNGKDDRQVTLYTDYDTSTGVPLIGQEGRACTAICGFESETGARIFLGMDDGEILLYDYKVGKKGALTAAATLEKLHSKTVVSMVGFGPYLVATGSDRLVSVWSCRGHNYEVLRKLRHRGPVNVILADGPVQEADEAEESNKSCLWCFDDSNKKLYQMGAMRILPPREPGSKKVHHQKQPTLYVDSGADILSGVQGSPIQGSPPPGSARSSPGREPGVDAMHSPGQPGGCPMLNISGDDFGRSDRSIVESERRLMFEDFSGEDGTVQDLFDRAAAWIHQKGISDRLASVTTVPVVGSSARSPASLASALNNADYAFDPSAGKVTVTNVVRVVYWG